MRIPKKISDWLKAIGIALLASWLLVNVVGKTSFVKENGMYPNLYSGDFVWINKWSCGFVFPKYPLSVPGTTIAAKFLEVPYHRFGRIDTSLRLNVIAYTDPINTGKIRFGRLIAYPTETVEVFNDSVYVNNKALKISQAICHQYQVKIRSDFKGVIDDYNIINPLPVSNQNDWIFELYNEQLLAFQADPRIKFIRPSFKKKGETDKEIFPFSPSLRYNKDHWGPIYIPQKNDSLLSNITWDGILCARLGIEFDSLQTLYKTAKPDSLHQVNKLKKYNYYAVLSDNRSSGIDSRYVGLIREDQILGTVPLAFLSMNPSLSFSEKLSRLFTAL